MDSHDVMDSHGIPPEAFPAMSPEMEDEEEEDWEVLHTSWDEEITHKLFGDLKRGLLGPPSNGKAIVISDSKEEEHGDDRANTDVAPSSLRVPPAPSAFATEDDGTLRRPLCQRSHITTIIVVYCNDEIVL
jgi:hypothetical protein